MHRIEFVFIRIFSDVVERWPRPSFSPAVCGVDIFNDNEIVIAELLIVLGQAVLKRRAFVTSPNCWLQILRKQFVSVHIALENRFPLRLIHSSTVVT